MADDEHPDGYWRLVESVWRSIDIYADPDQFERQFRACETVAAHLFAMH